MAWKDRVISLSLIERVNEKAVRKGTVQQPAGRCEGMLLLQNYVQGAENNTLQLE